MSVCVCKCLHMQIYPRVRRRICIYLINCNVEKRLSDITDLSMQTTHICAHMCIWAWEWKKTHYKPKFTPKPQISNLLNQGGCRSENQPIKAWKSSQLPHNMYIWKLIQAKQTLPSSKSQLHSWYHSKMDKTFPLKL